MFAHARLHHHGAQKATQVPHTAATGPWLQDTQGTCIVPDDATRRSIVQRPVPHRAKTAQVGTLQRTALHWQEQPTIARAASRMEALHHSAKKG
mmetsp:Transcript_78106/g.208843  ORF Transcript_78106/g.208843 Transcript_78106/m.208843 type:complete len:94 (+) Transcript_78106:317-598(+)